MNFDNEQTRIFRMIRVKKLQQMLQEQKRDILTEVKHNSQSLLANKKFKKQKRILQDRIQMTLHFLRQISDVYFCMLSDPDFLLLTAEIEIYQKVGKFRKNIQNSLQKLALNLNEQNETKQKVSVQRSNQMKGNQEQELQEQEYRSLQKSNKSKSKNCKISTDATLAMMEWLLRNFQNPYPTIEQKQQMAKEGNISLNKVNNWFINIRQRTVKGYFYRD